MLYIKGVSILRLLFSSFTSFSVLFHITQFGYVHFTLSALFPALFNYFIGMFIICMSRIVRHFGKLFGTKVTRHHIVIYLIMVLILLTTVDGMPLEGDGIREIFLAARTEKPVSLNFLRMPTVGMFDDVTRRRSRHVTKLTKHSGKNSFFHLLLPPASDQMHSHGSHVGKSDLALRAREPERFDSLRVALVGMRVILATVDENLGTK